jgi:two-component system sensor histidine kinase QseC
MLRNLLENALEHTSADGVVGWRVSADGAALELADEGPGAPAGDLPRLTQRFFRGSTKVATGEGAGLGLAIAAAAAEQCGARLSFENRQDRSGLVARIVFPEGSLTLRPAAAA